jgi:Domain of unknown function (DUF2357)/PD-(D/E)XK nuclease superfamily
LLSVNYSPEPARGEITPSEIDLLRHVTVNINRYPIIWRSEVVLGERDRLEFEIDIRELPLDIYAITLEIERDEVTQGIPVQWNIRRPTNKVATGEWMRQMQEEQYAGDSSITLLYRGFPVPGFTATLLFQVTRLAHQHYEYMREVLKEQNEKVLYSEKGRTHELAILSGAKTAASARYDIVAAHYDRFRSVIPNILDQPHRELREIVSKLPANNTKSLNYRSLRLAARNGAHWSPLPTTPQVPLEELTTKAVPAKASPGYNENWKKTLFESLQKKQSAAKPTPAKVLPTYLPVPQLEEAFDTFENRFLKMTTLKLVDLTKTVEKQLQEEIQMCETERKRSSRRRGALLATRIQVDQKCVLNLRLMRSRLQNILKNSFLERVGKMGMRRTSVVLRENRYYRQIRLIEKDIEVDLNLSASTIGLEKTENYVRLSSVNQLYEYWTTVTVLQTMVEKLGFTALAKDGRPFSPSALSKTSRYNYILQSGGAMELLSPNGRQVIVHFDREYPNGKPDESFSVPYGYFVPYGFGSTKRRPDIAIEVFHEGERVPKIVVLDATYSRDPRTLYTKYQYRDSIRDFTRTDPMSNTPARPVVAAWVIFPDEPSRLEHDEFRFGQLPLQPSQNAIDQLVPILRKLLQVAGALD